MSTNNITDKYCESLELYEKFFTNDKSEDSNRLDAALGKLAQFLSGSEKIFPTLKKSEKAEKQFSRIQAQLLNINSKINPNSENAKKVDTLIQKFLNTTAEKKPTKKRTLVEKQVDMLSKYDKAMSDQNFKTNSKVTNQVLNMLNQYLTNTKKNAPR